MLKFIPGLFAIVLLSACTKIYQIPAAVDSKQNPYKDKYADFIDEGSELIKSWYHFTLERTADTNYVYKQYYPTTRQITDYITYKTARMKVRHGKVVQWYDDGKKFLEGQFVDDVATGEWRYYHEGLGSAQSYGQLVKGKKDGIWTQLDSLGNVRSTYTYKDDIRHGPFQIFSQDGQLIVEGRFEKGAVADRNPVAMGNEDGRYALVDIMPHVKSCTNKDPKALKECSDEAILKAIGTVKYPRFARAMQIEGTAIVQFKVTTTGEIEDVTVIRGVCNEIKRNCIKFLDQLPEWSPGKHQGQAVNVYYRMPIKFILV